MRRKNKNVTDSTDSTDSTPVERLSARILCLPANDRADEVTDAMLAQLLEQAVEQAQELVRPKAS